MEEIAACPPGPTNGSQLPYDIAHEREFYKYYEPLSLGLAGQNPYGDHSGPAQVRASPDRTITAFAQLAALRLNCRRAFISFFSREHQHIIGESTQSLSLSTDCESKPGDGIAYGVTIVPKKGSICEHTVHVPFQINANDGDESVFLVEDLRKDERFKSREYTLVKDFVFYAGTPIISPGGFSIGAFCVIDDKPRKGLSQDEVAFLKDLATTTMVHMDMLRARAESLQGERMVRGLGSFVEGKRSIEDWWMNPNDKSNPAGSSSTTGRFWADRQYSRHHSGSSQEDVTTLSPTVLGLRLAVEQEQNRRETHASSDECLKPLTENPKAKETSQVDSPHVEVKHTYGRASCVIREALKIDAVCFFDAKAGATFGGLVDQAAYERPKRRKLSLSEDSDSGRSFTGLEDDAGGSEKADDKPCEILGFSTNDLSSINGDETVKVTDGMTETYLRALLRRYPRGRIMTFDEHSSPPVHTGTPQDDDSETTAPKSITGSPIKKRKRLRSDEAKLLKMFPRCRSLAIVPMYDFNHQFFSACVAWTVSPTRVLTHQSELNYLAAFSDTIMAEISRITASKADKAKGDFISSISVRKLKHELRSPLHGILGSVDLLQDSTLDTFQESLVHTVETCGKTLLDTVDHLLDFSKINNFARKHQRRGQNQNSDGQQQNSALDVDVDLSVITEEVLETAFAGHDFVKAGYDMGQFTEIKKSVDEGTENPGSKRTVSIVVNIDKAQDSHWVFRTQAGAWRRMLMNLFGNSLKYTERGFIQVMLEALPLPERHKTGRSKVILTVRDSGKGIGRSYLEKQLFVPFAQEDSLQPGTGLGLSITATIVRSMGGEIAVHSEQGKGTEVIVTIEMAHAPLSQETVEQSTISTAAKKLNGLKIGFVGFEAECFEPQPKPDSRSPENAYHLFMDSFSKMCRNWFGMEIKIMIGLDESDADVLFTTEFGLDQIQDELGKNMRQQSDKDAQDRVAQTPLLVITNSVAAANAMMHQEKSHISGIISQPCGPRKLAKSLTLCLEQFEASKDPDKPTPTVREALGEHLGTDGSENGSRQDGGDKESATYDDGSKESKSIDEETKDDISASGPALRHPQRDVLQMLQEQTSLPAHGGLEQRDKSYSQATTESFNSPGPSDKIRRNVLLVDDNKINLQLLVTYARKRGHKFKTANNGLEAFEAYKAEFSQSPKSSDTEEKQHPPFDFVLMDLSMPVMDGLESTRCIRGFEREKSMKPSKIIALTGLASASVQQEAFGSGVNIFMTKPVKLKELGTILEKKDKGE